MANAWITGVGVCLCVILIAGLAWIGRWREVILVKRLRALKDSQDLLRQDFSELKSDREPGSEAGATYETVETIKEIEEPDIPSRAAVRPAEAELLMKVSAAARD